MREKLIELLNIGLDNIDRGALPWAVEMLADNLIASGVTIATDNNVGHKWIPVAERLPKESGDYLAYCGNGYIGLMPYSTQYKLLYTFDGCGTKHAIAVTHWMPLPQPPEGE